VVGGITYEPIERPGVANLLRIHAALSPEGTQESTPEGAAEVFKNLSNKEFKERVGERVVESLKGIREEMERLRRDRGHVEKLLEHGEEKARCIADKTLKEVRKVMGFYQ
jgi:tryptophanyl-tRNA synthetase